LHRQHQYHIGIQPLLDLYLLQLFWLPYRYILRSETRQYVECSEELFLDFCVQEVFVHREHLLFLRIRLLLSSVLVGGSVFLVVLGFEV